MASLFDRIIRKNESATAAKERLQLVLVHRQHQFTSRADGKSEE